MAAIVATDHAKWARFFRWCITSIVGDTGGGRDGAPCPFGYRVVMIVCAHVRDHFGAARPIRQRRKALTALIGTTHGVFGGVAPLDL
jgi:hypothetical protein